MLRKTSILFGNVNKLAVRNKSSFVYETDKTFAQRFVEKGVAKVKANQKFHGVGFHFRYWHSI